MRKRDHGAQENHARPDTTDPPGPRRSLRARLLVTVAVPIAALLVALGAILVVRTDGARAADESRAALQSQLALARTTSLVVDAETGARGYLATGRADFLEPYDRALDQLPAARTELWRLLAADPGQADALRRLDPAITAELTALATVRTTGPGAAPARRSAVLAAGKTTMDALRAVLDELGRRARTVQDEKAADAARLRGAVTAITVTAGAVGLVGGLVAILVVSAGVTRRVNLVQDNARRLADGRPLLPVTAKQDELGVLGATMSRTAEVMADRQALLELTLTAGGLLLFEIHAGGAVAFRGDPRLLADLGLTADHPMPLDEVRRIVPLPGTDPNDRPGTAATDITVPTTDGDERRLAVRWRRLPEPTHSDSTGGPGVVVVGVATDVTDRVRAQQAFELARDAAENANRAKDEFLSRMSHELRTPLNAVLGFAQLLSMDDLDEEQRDNVDHILRGGRHLLALVNEVLDLSRVESGTFALSIEPIRVWDVADDAVRMMRPIAAEHGIAVALRSDGPREVHVDADQQRLKQLLVNLISNGIKYNLRGGSVHVGWSRAAGDRVELDVTDTGHGIAAHKLPELFTPFERLGAEQTPVEGTGLGLALSHRLAQAMNGELRLASTGDDGSRFVVTLPGAEAPCAPPAADDAGTGSAAAPPDLHDVRMLYVEDNLANLSLIEELVRRAQAPAPLTAVQGRLGIELAQVHQPDLILLDRHLPDMRGDEVLQRLRADPRTAGIPVIVISADVMPGRGSALRDAGAVAFLTKPVDVEAFWSAVRIALTPGRDQP